MMTEKQVSLESAVAVSDDAVFRVLEGEAVILNLKTGTYFGLNEAGTRIWSLIQEHGSLRRVFEVMQQEYQVAPQELETDILDLVDQLHSKGLVNLAQPQEQK
jgi:Coenzyme PQQ synthesis protein D (PqqD)